MSDLPVKEFCPLGHKCESISENKVGEHILKRCKWYQHIKGQNPQTGELVDEWDCSLVWMNILSIEATQKLHSSVAAIESFRNEVTGGIKSVIALAASNKTAKIE